MFYLHMTPPVLMPPASGSATARDANTAVRLATPSRPKSAAPAIRIPSVAPPVAASMAVVLSSGLPLKGGTGHNTTVTTSPRATAYVGFSPRAPAAPRPVAATPSTTTLGGSFEPVLQAHTASPSPRRLSYGHAANSATEQPTQTSANVGFSTSTTTRNVYHAMTARKSAEETAKQLERRIAHYRAQEEKVLREVQQMKQRLENMIAFHYTSDAQDATEVVSSARKPLHTLKRPMSATHASRMAQRHDLKTPRSREQLQFLTKQRRVIQYRNSEAARQQKKKRQAALELQRQKDAAEQSRRAATKERIRQERQLAIDQRAARQHKLLDTLEQQHHARLRQEQTREMEVKQRISNMREEEQNLALRLQALQVHQEHMKRGLEDSSPSKRLSPPRPRSAAPAPR